MTSLTHASIGAVAGEFIPNPFIAFFVGIILHLVFDKVPHYWPASKKGKGTIIFLDTLLSAAFLATILLSRAPNYLSVFAGGLGGVSVDFYFVLVMRSKGKLAEWHTNRQYHKTNPWWVLSDLLLFGIFTSLLAAML